MTRILILLLFLIANVNSFGQQYSFLQYSLKEGLPQSQVRSIFQDSRGYLWIGTLGGVAKFNGSTFINYDRSSGLINNQINTIIQNKKGQIIVGSIGGISIHKYNKFHNHLLHGNLKDASVTSLYEVSENQILVGTEKGLVRFNGDTLIQDNNTLFFDNEFIRSISKDESNTLYVLTKSKLYKQDAESGQWIEVLSLNNPEEFFQDFWIHKNSIWYTTTNGGIRIYNSTEEKITPQLLPYLETTELMFTNIDVFNDYAFFCCRSGVLQYQISSGTTQFLTSTNGLLISDVRAVLVDRENNPWIATYGGGVFKYLGNGVRTYTTNDGLAGNAVMTMFKHGNNLFFGTFDNGLTSYFSSLNEPIGYRLVENIKNEKRIWTSATDWQFRPWVGTLNGVYYYEQNCGSCPRWFNFNSSNGLHEDLVLSLLPTSQGMYVGTNKGFQLIQENGIQSFNEIPNFPNTRIRHMIQARDGAIWMATREGLTKFNGSTFQSFGEETGWTDPSSFSVVQLPSGLIAAGTQNGLYVGNEGGFEHKSIHTSPGSNTINFLKVIRNHLWIGTLNGVYLWEFDGNGNLGSMVRHLNQSDGLISLETNLNAILEDYNTVWIGTPSGVISLDLNAIESKFQNPIPIVHLTNIQTNLQDINWFEIDPKWDGLKLPENIEFSHIQNSFTFHFDASSTTYPERVVYSYWLEGLDETWSMPTQFTQVNFNNLPAGLYTFHIRSRVGETGDWSAEEAWSFRVLPPWWLTWWVIILELLFIGFIVSLIVRIRQRNLRNKLWAEQSELKAKLLMLEQQSMNSSMNRHFIFNALNSIQYYINRQDRKLANQYLTDFAKLIRKNLESGQENYTPLSEELDRLELYLKLEQMRFPGAFEYKIITTGILNLNTLRIPAMLLQPFLENSIWHGLIPKGSEGFLKLEVTEISDRLMITIEDNGIGIEASQLRKTSSDTHISKGMEITRNRLDLIQQMTQVAILLEGPTDITLPSGKQVTRVKLIFPKEIQEIFSERTDS